MNVISVNNLSFSYGSNQVLSNVDFKIDKEDFVCIVGPNGGGKTTLLKLILGILTPDSGTIDVLGRKPKKTRFKVGYMPQYMEYDQQFPATVLDVVLMGRLGRSFLGWYSKKDKEIALDCLHQVGLEHLVDRPFVGLSGGQRQRVLFARALSCEPEIFIFDEPTSNVDAKSQSELLELMNKLGQKIAVILVSHDVRFVDHNINKVICVDKEVRLHSTYEISQCSIQDVISGNMKVIKHDHKI